MLVPSRENLDDSIFPQTRENFKASRDDIQSLMRRMLEVRQTVRSYSLDKTILIRSDIIIIRIDYHLKIVIEHTMNQ